MTALMITCTRCLGSIPMGKEKDLLDYDNMEVYVFCQECYDKVYYQISQGRDEQGGRDN